MAKKGVEIIVGTLLDATFGPMIMVGLGGITTELFRDVVYRPAPVSAAEASAMLAELKAAPLLNGFRGAAKADVAALSQLIAQVSVLAAQQASEISEIEINPVLVHPEGHRRLRCWELRAVGCGGRSGVCCLVVWGRECLVSWCGEGRVRCGRGGGFGVCVCGVVERSGRVCGLPSRSRSGTMIEIKMGARQPPKEFAQ